MHQLKRIIIFVTLCLVFLSGFSESSATPSKLSLTEEEQAYIAQKGVIKAVSLHGVAPIQYADKNGQVQGISKRVLQEVAEMTGLRFEYKLYETLREAFASDAEMVFGMPPQYALPGMVLSKPYLRSETILYINSAQDLSDLDNKKYAAVKGSALPQGIKEENSIYFDTREQSIDAVDAGKADYGYGNAYSVAFYTLQNGYKNLVTIPKGKESRAYCIGFFHKDELLISIINKSLSAMGESQLENLVLDVASQVERKITFPMVMNAYTTEIVSTIFVVVGILLFAIISRIKANKRLAMINRRYETLGEVSNEYLFEYFPQTNHLQFSDNFIQQLGTQEHRNEAANMLKNALKTAVMGGQHFEINMSLAAGETSVFKVIYLTVSDDNGHVDSIIGKLVDISDEVRKREELSTKAQVDGLTGLCNAKTTKELIQNAIYSRQTKQQTDACILIDVDYFKAINDTQGHLAGDEVLIHLGRVLKRSFRTADISGRIGGDEFCVYMTNVPSLDFVKTRCRSVSELIQTAIADILVTISVGIALVDQDIRYEEIFQRSDEALYDAKRNGRNQIAVYERKLE